MKYVHTLSHSLTHTLARSLVHSVNSTRTHIHMNTSRIRTHTLALTHVRTYKYVHTVDNGVKAKKKMNMLKIIKGKKNRNEKTKKEKKTENSPNGAP